MKELAIEVEGLSKRYGHVDALRNITLGIAKRDIYGIIGLSGAGKSTLLRCLAGLIAPTAGRVSFLNEDLSALGKKSLRISRKKMGMIFQHFNLLSSRTVAGNIAYPLEIAGMPSADRERRVDELLRLVGLSSKKEAYPASLSGGQKQRVGIARALANHPEVLFCDEATSALDPKTTKEILDLLREINHKMGVTIVLITHDMEVIKRICNRVAVLEAGEIVEEGPVAEIFGDPQNPTTKHFIQGCHHQVPEEFFQPPSPNRKLIRFRFKGKTAGEPLISHIVKKYDLDANILLGWIDRLQTATIGTLVVELTGSAEGLANALAYLMEKKVDHEVLQNEL